MTEAQAEYKTKKYHDPLDDVLDRPIAYNPAFRTITGSTTAALMLSQAWYWSKRKSDDDGWFYKTRPEWCEETGLTEDELDGARKKCKEVGVIEEKLKGAPAKLFYRVNKAKVYEKLGLQIPTFPESCLVGNSQIPEKQESGNPANINRNAETTPEITKQGASALSEKEFQEANAMVDAIIENSGRQWKGRENFRDNHLVYADWWHELTGQPITKAQIKSCWKAFSAWQNGGLTIESLREAYDNRILWKKVIADPNEITPDAAAIQALPPEKRKNGSYQSGKTEYTAADVEVANEIKRKRAGLS